jgi:hypothetical protein
MAWRYTFRRLPRRRLTAGLALLAYLAAAFGFPLPALPVKDHGQRYPCEDHACGCRNAEDCWLHCCCHTPEERWAWARANHVEPPAYAERPASEGWNTVRLRDQAAEEESCPACCHECAGQAIAAPTSEKPCCASHHTGGSCCQPRPPGPAQDARPQPGTSVRWVVGMAALHCRGASTLWVSSGAVVPPPPTAAWSPCLLPLGWVSCREAALLAVAVPPAVPPPRKS